MLQLPKEQGGFKEHRGHHERHSISDVGKGVNWSGEQHTRRLTCGRQCGWNETVKSLQCLWMISKRSGGDVQDGWCLKQMIGKNLLRGMDMWQVE